MERQLILTIGRQYGSNGHEIGVKLAQYLHVECYDKAKLIQISKGTDHYEEMKAFYEERPVNSLLFAISMNQIQPHSHEIPFTRIQQLFQEKSGILIGRCGNAIFRKNQRAVRILKRPPAVCRRWMKNVWRSTGISPTNAGGRQTGMKFAWIAGF